MLTGEKCQCGGELYRVDDQHGRWWEDCSECNRSKLITGKEVIVEEKEETCSRCGDGGCFHCEPWRFI